MLRDIHKMVAGISNSSTTDITERDVSHMHVSTSKNCVTTKCVLLELSVGHCLLYSFNI